MALRKRFRTFAKESSDRAAAQSFDAHLAGDMLRQRRQQLGLDLGDVAAVLKIKPAYLEALEQGRTDKLPAPVYAIGFMRGYADFLGLDSGEILRRVKRGLSGLTARADLSFPIRLGEDSMPGGEVLLAAMILACCGYGTWYFLSTGEGSHPERVAQVPAELLPPKSEVALMQPTAPQQSEVLTAPEATVPAADGDAPAGWANPALPLAGSSAAPPTAPVSVHSVAAAAGTEPSSSAVSRAGGRGAQIIIRATAASWVQISDRKRTVLVARVLKPGETYEVLDEPGLTMRTGNAGGLAITVGGNPAPPIGPAGGVRRRVMLDPQALAAGAAVHD